MWMSRTEGWGWAARAMLKSYQLTRCRWCTSFRCCRCTAPGNSHLQRTVHRWTRPQAPYHLLPRERPTKPVTASIKHWHAQKWTYSMRAACWWRDLDFPGAVVHHAMLGSHGWVFVEFGGVEGDLLHLGDFPEDVRGAGASGLILVQPVVEELFKQRGLAPFWQDLHLTETSEGQGTRVHGQSP